LNGDIESGSASTFCWIVVIVVCPAASGTTRSITASPKDVAEM
jgi:hypothetical protein